MQLHDAIRSYPICAIAEGYPKIVTSQYQRTLNMFLEAVDDMDVAMFTPDHVKRFLDNLQVNQPIEMRKHVAVLRIFSKWLKAQNQIRQLVSQHDLTRRPSRW